MRALLIGVLAFITFSFVSYDIISCPEDIEVPSAFTPNGDGNNDVFKIEWPCEPISFEIRIFNNWDEPIFSSSHFYFQWDGKLQNGQDAPAGVYSYTLNYAHLDQDYILEKEIVLMR